MADEIGRISGTVVVGSDTKGLSEAEAAFRQLDKAGKEVAGNLGDLALDLDLSSLEGAEAALADVSSAAEGLGDSLAGAELDIDTSGLEGAGAALGDVGDSATAAAADVDELGASAAQAGDQVEGLGEQSQKSASLLDRIKAAARDNADGVGKMALALGAVGAASKGLDLLSGAVGRVTATLGDAVSSASEYQQSVTLISTLGAESASRFDEYKSGILEVSQALGQDAVASARAAYDAISSGVDPGAAVAFLETASKAATAGVTSVDAAGKALTVTLNSFNLSASETTAVSDAMFATANVGVTTFDELAASFGGVASIAASSNATYEETLAVIGQLTTKGATTSQAVTQLKAAFVALAKPHELVNEAFRNQGFASAEAAIQSEGLHFALETIRQVSEDTGVPVIELVGSTEALNAVLGTTGENAAATQEKILAVGDAAGATQAAFDLISETPAQRMAVFRSSVDAARIALGDALLPVIGALLDALTPLVQSGTHFIQSVLVPLGERFGSLPEPIRLVIGLLTGLVGGAATLAGGLATASAVLAPLAGLFTSAGAGAGVLGVAAGAAGTALSAMLGPVGLVIGAVALLSQAHKASGAALDEQLAALDRSSAGFDEYVQATARARAESGAFAQVGFGVRAGLDNLSDNFLIAKEQASNFASSLAGGLSSALSLLRGEADEAGAEFEALGGRIEPSVYDIVAAGQAFLELGTNIQPAVLQSEQFRLAHAKLDQAVRDGRLNQEQYEAALLSTANALSMAQGAGAVLTAEQQRITVTVGDTLQTIAESSGVLSAASLASEDLATKQGELATAVAQGRISAQEAQDQWRSYIADVAAGDTAMQASISANQALAQGYADLSTQLASGQISYQDAASGIQQLGVAAGATQEQLAEMTSALGGLALSPELAEFGLSLDFATIQDPDALVKELEDIRATAHEAVFGLFSEQLQARQAFQAQEQALIDERPRLIADAEAKAQQAIAQAQAEGNTDKIAQVHEGLAQEIEAISSGNAQKLEALRAGFEQERQERLNALAQAALDQVNSLLQLGQISEQQAQIIFGSLQEAAPDSSLFDPASQAALSFSATLGQALSGDVVAAVGLGAELANVDAALAASEAAAAEYEAGAVAAYQNARAALAASAGGAVVAADVEIGANQARMASAQELDTALGESLASRDALRGADSASAALLAEGVVAADSTVRASTTETAGHLDAEYGRMSGARAGAASTSKATTDEMVGDTQRLRAEASATGSAVDTSVRGIGDAYVAGAAGVRVGAEGIVTETARANQSLGGLGAEVPARLAPAVEAVGELKGEAALLAEVTADTASARVSAEEDAASAATSASGETVSGFVDVADQSRETLSAIEALREELERLPKRVDIPLLMTGADAVRKATAEVLRDLEALEKGVRFRIEGTYTGTGGAERQSPMAVLTDIREIYDATASPFVLGGAYTGEGGAAWTGAGLALGDAIDQLRDQAIEPIVFGATLFVDRAFELLLFNTPFESAFLADAKARLAELTAEAERLQQAADAIRASRLEEVFGRMTAAISAFFDSDAEGGLRRTLELLAGAADTGGVAIDEAAFLRSLGFDFSTFDELQARIEALRGEPDKQRELWQALVKGLGDQWRDFHDDQKEALEAQRDALREQIDAAGEGADASALESQLEGIEARLDALDDRNAAITGGLKDQADGLGRILDAYKLIHDEVQALERAAEAERKAAEQALREAERAIKERQRASEEAEKDAHGQVMDLLDAEQKARERAHKDELRRLDTRRKETEADVERRLAAGEEEHRRRLAAITAEVDAEQARLDAEDEILTRAKLLVDTIEAGNAIAAGDADFLRSLGIDPDEIVRANAGLVQTRTRIDEVKRSLDLLQGLFDKLPDELGRVQIAGSNILTEAGKQLGEQGAKFSDEERARLHDLLGSGTLSKRDRRIVEVFLAGGVVQARRLREILGPAITADEAALETAQAQVDAAKEQVDLAGQILAKREAGLKLAQHDNDLRREGLAEQIAAEKARFDAFKEGQQARLDAIDEEKRQLKEASDAFREAISEAKEAEKARHEARMAQLQEEYALELLRLGLSEEEVEARLVEQAERAARIATEARERFRRLLEEAERAANLVGVGGFTPGGPTTRQPISPAIPIPVPPVPTPPPSPILPPVLPPRPGLPTLEGAVLGLPPELASALAEITGQAAEAGAMLADGLLGPAEDALGSLATAGGEAGQSLAQGLVDPTLRRMADLLMQATELRSVLTDLPTLGGRVGEALSGAPSRGRGLVHHEDRSRHFTVNGDVNIRPDDPAGDALLDSLGVR